jgi:predicted TIM-barrel fold metal-dependent hydrolase
MIVDCHCHAGLGDGGPHDPDARIEAYLRRAARAGIGATVLVAVAGRDSAAANRHVGRLVLARPDRLVGFARVHAGRDGGRIRELATEAVDRFDFGGIKAHGRDAALTREVCDAARALRLPLLYNPAGRLDAVRRLAPDYGDVTFILSHLGGFDDDWATQRAVTDLLERLPNVHADTSGVRHFDVLAAAVRRAGPHKLLFGSDGPWLHPGLELEKVRLLRLPAADEALILGGNALRLIPALRRLGSPPPPAPGPWWPVRYRRWRRYPRPWRPWRPRPYPRPRPRPPRRVVVRPRPAGGASARRGR